MVMKIHETRARVILSADQPASLEKCKMVPKSIIQILTGSCGTKNKCIICFLHRTVRLTFILIPISGQCKHLVKNYTGKPCFIIMKRWLWISCVISILLFLACSIQFLEVHYKIIDSEESASKIEGLMSLEELCYILSFLVMYLITLVSCKKRLVFLNAVVDLIDNESYIETFSSPWECSSMIALKYRKKRFIALLAFLTTDLMLVMVSQHSKIIYINILLTASILMFTVMGVQIFREISILTEYRSKIDRSFMNHMESKIHSVDQYTVTIDGSSKTVALEDRLKLIQIYYSEFYTCIEDHLNCFMGPILILWCISSLILLVLDFYMMILLIEKDVWYRNCMDELRTYAHIFTVILLMKRGTCVTTISDDTLSFLFKYPISKLSETEAYQVEMLIYTLSTHKPTIKASDIFTVGTQLLASISGTVVTYVLVALQFRPAWSD